MLAFFHCIAAAINDLNRASNGSDRDSRPPMTPIILAAETIKRWRDSSRLEEQQGELRQELEQAAQMILEEFEPKMRQIARIVAPEQPPIQEVLAKYLALIPERIRKKFSRVDDPTGTTVPITWALRQPQDIIALLSPAPKFEVAPPPRQTAPESTSPIRFSCNVCSATLTITTKNPGDRVSCPNCGKELTVPPRPPNPDTVEIKQPPPIPFAQEIAKPVERDWRTAPPESTLADGRHASAAPLSPALPFAIVDEQTHPWSSASVPSKEVEAIEVRDWRTTPPPVPADTNAAPKPSEEPYEPAAPAKVVEWHETPDLANTEEKRREPEFRRSRRYRDDDDDSDRRRLRREFENDEDFDHFESEESTPQGKGVKSVLVFLLFYAIPFTLFIAFAIQYWKVQILVSVMCLSGALFSGIFGLLHVVINAKKRHSR